MTNDSPARTFLLPRLAALLQSAVDAGFQRDVAVAVMIDLVTSPLFDTAAPDPLADSAPSPGWDRGSAAEPIIGGRPLVPPAIGAQDEADFVKPLNWLDE